MVFRPEFSSPDASILPIHEKTIARSPRRIKVRLSRPAVQEAVHRGLDGLSGQAQQKKCSGPGENCITESKIVMHEPENQR